MIRLLPRRKQFVFKASWQHNFLSCTDVPIYTTTADGSCMIYSFSIYNYGLYPWVQFFPSFVFVPQNHDIKEEKKRKRKRPRLCPHFHGSDGNQTLIWSLCPRHEPTYKTKGGVLGRMKHSSGTKRRNGVSRDGSLGKDSRFVCQGNVSLFLFLVVLRVLCD